MKFADLHVHTVFSDGTSTPEEVVIGAAKNGLAAISVADHDTVGSTDRALTAGKEYGVEVLPAIELTAEYRGIEIHMLGYLIDYRNKLLIEKLDFLKRIRIERIYKIVDKLHALGMPLQAEDVFALANEGVPGRLHVARVMAVQGFVKNIYGAFKQYIGDSCPAYVGGFRFTPSEAIQLIKAAGGIPVLAHPYLLKDDQLILEFIGCGLMGLEVYYLEHSQGMINYYLEMAGKYNLLVTGGSDFHGQAKPEVALGMLKLPYERVEKLKEAKARLNA